jgi:hypothetical protein
MAVYNTHLGFFPQGFNMCVAAAAKVQRVMIAINASLIQKVLILLGVCRLSHVPETPLILSGVL